MEKFEPLPILIADAGPIIHLDELDVLWILSGFPQILIPPIVWEEVKVHRPSALSRSDLSFSITPVTAQPSEMFSILARASSLHSGEKQALLLMQHFPEALFLTDDASARFVAIQLGFQIAGTVGMLIRAARINQIPTDQVISLLEAIPARSTLFIRSSLLSRVVTKLREEFGK